jgi:hypothetical protein
VVKIKVRVMAWQELPVRLGACSCLRVCVDGWMGGGAGGLGRVGGGRTGGF